MKKIDKFQNNWENQIYIKFLTWNGINNKKLFKK